MTIGIPASIRLEPLTSAHAPEMFPLLSHPAIYQYIPEPPPTSVAALTARYQRLEGGTSPDGSETWLNWVIRRLEDMRCVGYVQATIYTADTADFAFVLAPAYWGLGLAHEASTAALAYLFAQSNVVSVFATVDRRNARSSALLTRLHFQRVPAGMYPHGHVESSDDVFELRRNV